MRPTRLLMLAITATMTAQADFSYVQTRKAPQGMMGGAAGGPQTTKHFLKGQKMRVDTGQTATILDYDAQTITVINNATKSYTVTKFADLGQSIPQSGVEARMDIKDTGQKKTINGFNASEMLMTMEIDSPEARQSGMKMQMEISTWVSKDVPGAAELHTFYEKNATRIPWASLAGAGQNPGMAKSIADMQRKLATMGGVPVLQVVRTKSPGNEAQMAQAQQGMGQARAQLEAMAKQGGPAAAAAQQALARMGGGAGGGSLFEVTTESTDFSTAAIPDSTFQIPAGYTKK